jgi:hexosaminidase
MKPMKKLIPFFCLLVLISCSKPPVVQDIAIIPQPESVVPGQGAFCITNKTVIVATEGSIASAEYLAGILKKGTGFDIPIVSEPKKNAIILVLETAANPSLGKEGYTLVSGSKNVTISASAPEGLFYGVQTLRQLLPAEIESPVVKPGIAWNIPAVEIKDQPRFAWRGMMLDCVRHFFPVSHIKNLLDIIAAKKMNHFHWHLIDDQGWRIEIKKYPELTATSAWRVDRENLPWNERPAQKPEEKATYGGFYTQDEIREVVAYAAKLNITVVPEIEMPAHVSCVFAAYPEFSCSGKKVPVAPGGVWPVTNIYCAGNEGTFKFLEDVLTEVIDLFPSQYIHVGGDEATKTNWEKCPKCQSRIKIEGLRDEAGLQSYFITRMEKFLNSKGRNLIGWDEILEGGLAPEATVMSWRGFAGGIAASKSGHDVVMSPTDFCYFDYYQGPKESEPLAIGGYLPLSKVYEFNLIPKELTADEAKHILGGQANLWTEFIPTPEHSEYMLFPRLDAMTEALWSMPENKNYQDFLIRLNRQFERYDNAGIKYSKKVY